MICYHIICNAVAGQENIRKLDLMLPAYPGADPDSQPNFDRRTILLRHYGARYTLTSSYRT